MGPRTERSSSAGSDYGRDPRVRPADSTNVILGLTARRSQIVRFLSQAFDKTAELFAAARMSQLSQGLRFDLADAFAGDLEILAHLFERVIGRFPDPETFAQHFLFSWRERLQRAVDLPLQVIPDCGFQR